MEEVHENKGVISATITAMLVLSTVILGCHSNTAKAITKNGSLECSDSCHLCLLASVAGPWWEVGCGLACGAACTTYDAYNNNSLVSIPKSDQHYFCNVGYASNFCSSFLAKPSPGLEKRCTDSCEQTCKNRNTTLPHI